METLTIAKFRFGNFEMDCGRRTLTSGGETLTLNPRTFDVLQELVENHGSILSKDELLARVWPGQFVEENNLTVQISALRKVFGDQKGRHDFIATIPGRGYSFIAHVDNLDNQTEIVVENRSFSRIIMEKQTAIQSNDKAESGGSRQTVVKKAQATSGMFAGRNRLILIGSAIIIFLCGGAYMVQKRLSAHAVSVARFTRHSVRQLTTNGKVGSAALSPDGKAFVYTIDDLGQKSLWLGYVAGGNHLLLREPAETTYRGLALSHDGSSVYFSIRDKKNAKGALYKMPVTGGVETKLLEEIGNFSLSPDDKQIAFSRHDEIGDADVIVVADPDTGERRDVISLPKDIIYRTGTLAWSADGNRLAFSAAANGVLEANAVFVADVTTGSVEKVNFSGVREITKIGWLKNGTGLILTGLELAVQPSVPQYQLWHMALPGGDISQITTDRSNYGASWHNDAGVTLSLSASTDQLLTVEHRQWTNVWVAPVNDPGAARQITNGSFGKYDGLWGLDWTPDGKLIYTTSDTRSQYLARMNADGSEQKPITAPGKVDSVLTVSADGRYILFHSNRADPKEMDIWRTDIDGSNPKQLTFGGKAFHPAPSADGKWVYYKSYLDGADGLCRVPMDGGDPECLTDKETSWMSFSPDGKYLAASYITDKQRLAIFSTETNQVIKQFELPATGTLYMGSRWTADSRSVVYRDKNFGYWLQPVDGGEPHQMEGLPKEKFYNFAYSRDGKEFAFVRGPEIRDVVLLETAD